MGHAVNKNRIGTIVEPPSIRTYWPPTVAFCPASLGLYYGAFPDRPALTGPERRNAAGRVPWAHGGLSGSWWDLAPGEGP